jgi:hypothetical protein
MDARRGDKRALASTPRPGMSLVNGAAPTAEIDPVKPQQESQNRGN